MHFVLCKIISKLNRSYPFSLPVLSFFPSRHPDYVLFGLENGQIRVSKLNQTSLTTIDTITAHDKYKGRITALKFIPHQSNLFSTGADGNIFLFKWNMKLPALPTQKQYSIESDLNQLPNVSDIVDREHLTLEQEKEKKLLNERKDIANTKKTKMLEIIGSLKIEFNAVKERNRKLPKDLQLTPADFELDGRITEHLQDEFNRNMQLVRRKLAYDVEKIKLIKSKVENYLVDNLKDWPIHLLGVR